MLLLALLKLTIGKGDDPRPRLRETPPPTDPPIENTSEEREDITDAIAIAICVIVALVLLIIAYKWCIKYSPPEDKLPDDMEIQDQNDDPSMTDHLLVTNQDEEDSLQSDSGLL